MADERYYAAMRLRECLTILEASRPDLAGIIRQGREDVDHLCEPHMAATEQREPDECSGLDGRCGLMLGHTEPCSTCEVVDGVDGLMVPVADAIRCAAVAKFERAQEAYLAAVATYVSELASAITVGDQPQTRLPPMPLVTEARALGLTPSPRHLAMLARQRAKDEGAYELKKRDLLDGWTLVERHDLPVGVMEARSRDDVRVLVTVRLCLGADKEGA